MSHLLRFALIAMFVSFASLPAARAQVSAQEAARLGADLTPLGAKRAGNEEGTIPSWSGGIEGGDSGQALLESIVSEGPVFSITPENVQQHAEKLPQGAIALFEKFPGYRMNVYASRRTAAAPDRVYENVRRNATRAKAAPQGIAYGVDGAVGGIPFPIPENGYQVMWNHLLAFWGAARETRISTYVVSANGTAEMTASYEEVADFPYYYPGATPESFGGFYFKTLRLLDAPPAKYGQGYLAWQPINIAENQFAAWRYIPGERRARRGPSLSYDTPDPDAAGYQTLDEYYLFFGGLDRYEFELVGKKEMYVPYNNNAMYRLYSDAILGAKYANPNTLRYELHRVWVVEAALADGASHVAPKRRFYIDEDTWFVVYSESWDENGNLWKFGHGTMYAMPEVPAVILGSQFIYDLAYGGYVYSFAFNENRHPYKVTPPHDEVELTPYALSSRALR